MGCPESSILDQTAPSPSPRKTELTTPLPPCNCLVVSVCLSFSPSRNLLLRATSHSSVETLPFLLTVDLLSLTLRDGVVPPVTITLSPFLRPLTLRSLSLRTTSPPLP